MSATSKLFHCFLTSSLLWFFTCILYPVISFECFLVFSVLQHLCSHHNILFPTLCCCIYHRGQIYTRRMQCIVGSLHTAMPQTLLHCRMEIEPLRACCHEHRNWEDVVEMVLRQVPQYSIVDLIYLMQTLGIMGS